MGERKYVTVSVPEELIEMAQRYVKRGFYRSTSEFVKEAIRLRLENLDELEHNLQRLSQPRQVVQH